MREWTDQQVETLRFLRRNGRPIPEIAKAVGKSCKGVETKLFRMAQEEGLAPQISQPATRVFDDR